MYTVHDAENGRQIAACATLSEADQALEQECRLVHAQAAANGEGTSGMQLRYEIRDALEDGRPVVWLSYRPDADRPFRPIMRAADLLMRP